jgi:S-methylmethionine-dependent homocysteine/selenocysteine methylase
MRRVVLTDGGMGQELLRRSGAAATPMWSAQIMIDRPELVRELHADFIRAGARVITINTYSATPERLARDGDASRFDELQRLGFDLADQARRECDIEGVRIAACLPPLVASYRPDVTPAYETCLSLYRRIVDRQAVNCDLMLCETLSSVKEIRAAATAARESGKPVWVGMTVRDDGSGRLRSGETLSEAHAALDEIGVDARLLNCSRPESIASAWREFVAGKGPHGAYANGFSSIAKLSPGGTVHELEAREDLGPDAYAEFAMGWVRNGASIVGGCCEVGPAHIARLCDRLADGGYLVSGDLRQSELIP